jgi:zinc transporter
MRAVLRLPDSVETFLLDEQGGGRSLTAEEFAAWSPEQGPLWVRFDAVDAGTPSVLQEVLGIDPVTAAALTADDTRPRSVPVGTGLLLLVRGVNLSQGADPEDMVSVRVLIDARRLVTLRRRPVFALRELFEALGAGRGATDVPGLLLGLLDGLLDRIGDTVESIDDAVDEFEDTVLHAESHSLRTTLADLRRQIIALRRYLAPQREGINRLYTERVAWLTEAHRAHLREAADRILRYVEDLDSARDRASVTMEQLDNRLSERMNRTMYLLAIVSAIFLPLGLVTGLLGINVGGMPGVDSPWAFTIVCAMLVVLAGVGAAVLKRLL